MGTLPQLSPNKKIPMLICPKELSTWRSGRGFIPTTKNQQVWPGSGKTLTMKLLYLERRLQVQQRAHHGLHVLQPYRRNVPTLGKAEEECLCFLLSLRRERQLFHIWYLGFQGTRPRF